MGLIHSAVEVGTHRGDFAANFIANWPGELHCVDPWEDAPNYESQSKFLWGGQTRQEDYQICLTVLEPFERVHIHKKTSQEALSLFEDESLDFVHLDGNHEPPYVRQDLNWWKKLRVGGILAGHDFACVNEPDGPWSQHIQRAVFEKFYFENIYLVTEQDGLPWSYYIIKGPQWTKQPV